MADSNMHVTVTADVSNYVAGMRAATKATRRLGRAYRSLPRRARMIARSRMLGARVF